MDIESAPHVLEEAYRQLTHLAHLHLLARRQSEPSTLKAREENMSAKEGDVLFSTDELGGETRSVN